MRRIGGSNLPLVAVFAGVVLQAPGGVLGRWPGVAAGGRCRCLAACPESAYLRRRFGRPAGVSRPIGCTSTSACKQAGWSPPVGCAWSTWWQTALIGAAPLGCGWRWWLGRLRGRWLLTWGVALDRTLAGAVFHGGSAGGIGWMGDGR